MNPRRSNALLLVALLLAVGLTPSVGAWHAVPDSDDRGVLEESPVWVSVGGVETGVPPVDRELERVPETIEAANGTIASTYGVLGETLNDVDGQVGGQARLPLTLFRDGAGGPDPADPADARDGGFGGVRTDTGTHPWDHTAEAAFRGQEGYATPATEHGTYPGFARALLVTPELDLRTLFPAQRETPETLQGQTGPAGKQVQDAGAGTEASGLTDEAGRTVSTTSRAGVSGGTASEVLGRLYWACDLAAAAVHVVSNSYDATAPACLAYRDMLEQQDMQISMEYRMRHNLALGNDGVAVMVFTEEPRSVEDAAGCVSRRTTGDAPTGSGLDVKAVQFLSVALDYAEGSPAPECRIVLPNGGYSTSQVASMPGGLGYTGYHDWILDAIDLTPWEGRGSVWVGFYFTTGTVLNQNYFASETLFPNQDAGYFGFHVDDVVVKSMATPVNLRVRSLVEPSHPTVNGVPTLHPDNPVPVRAHVTNLGATTFEATVVTRILHASDRSVAATAPEVMETLTPGSTLEVTHAFDASGSIPQLGIGRYVAQVCAYRSSSPSGDGSFCDDPAPDECSSDSLNADPCAQLSEVRFEIRPLQAIAPGAVRMGQNSIQVGDTTAVQMPIRNDGNRDETLQVQAFHVAVPTPDGLKQDLIPPSQRDPVSITLAPGEEKALSWDLSGSLPGQYRFVALVNSTGEVQPTFSAQHDLQPSVLRPWRSAVLEGDITVDGDLDETDWLRLQDLPLGVGGAVARVGNSDTHLLLGLVNTTAPGVALFLNDGGDDDITSGGGGVGILVNGDGAQGLRYDASTSTWAPDSVPVEGARLPFGSSGGHWTYELRIPINMVSGGPHAGPGEAVGMLLRSCDAVEPDLTCTHFPHAVPLHDGAGFHAADGDLEDEVRQWHTVRLGDPARVVPGAATPYSEVVVGPGFGVGAQAPPLFLQEFDECPTFKGWAQLTPRGVSDDHVEKWNCHRYGDDGRTLLYKGVGPDNACACPPYSGNPGADTPERFVVRDPANPDWFSLNPDYVRDESFLWTPPIDVPADAVEPTLVLAHQYSTDVEILDTIGKIRLNHLLNVSVEEWVPDEGRWVDRGPLEPIDGYTSEESLGIDDPRYGPREYFTRDVVVDTNNVGSTGRYADRECPHSLTRFGPGPDGENRGITTSLHQDCAYADSLETWWWPQGTQDLYRSPDGVLPKPTEFHGGSPWTTALVPLHGEQLGRVLDLDGRTIRLRFSMDTNDRADRSPDTEHDWGWRIGGLAVLEGGQFLRDLSVTSTSLEVGYDPFEVGVGPGTSIPVRVEVRNDGMVQAGNIQVTLAGEDLLAAPGEELLCGAQGDLPGILLPGTTRNVTLACVLEDRPGALLSLRTEVRMQGGEDFTGNNFQRVRGHFPLRASADATLLLNVTPRDASASTPRTVAIQVQNLGNVPLDEVGVTMEVFDVSDPSRPPLRIDRHTWTASSSLPVQVDAVPLQDLMGLDDPPRFTPDKVGTYAVRAQVDVPGATPSRSHSTTIVQASDVLFRDDLDRAAHVDESVVEGAVRIEDDGVWTRAGNDGAGGSEHLLAGDLARGEIPADTDAVVSLPDVDLSSLRSATLSFRHRYDLEAGFDAARVEFSTDGETWLPLTPQAQPLDGLPDGYPSLSLLGASPLLDDVVQCFACSFTGGSGDLPGNQDGWVTAEFDLARQPRFFQEAPLDSFPLEGLASDAGAFPRLAGGELQFLSESWVLDEPNAEGNQRYWWIRNSTYSEPQPLTANRMWWSGSAGGKDPSTGEIPPVDTSLSLSVDPDDLDLGGDDLVVSFWDWRAGWAGLTDDDRPGTGGAFHVTDLDGQSLEVRVVERRPDGWTKREVDLSTQPDDDVLGLTFQYISGSAEGSPWSCYSLNCPQNEILWALVQDNRGWFIDRVEWARRTTDGDVALPISNDARTDEGTQVTTTQGDTLWSRVTVGGSTRDGGWHIAPVQGPPGQGTVPSWRFASDDGQGYPPNADSRLVTPVVDLRQYNGDSVRFQFDHRYDLHGSHSGVYVDGRGYLGRAIDAGLVEYQVFDETTGQYGSWRQLGARAEPLEPGLVDRPLHRSLWLLDPEQKEAIDATGYPSLVTFPPAPSEEGACAERGLSLRVCSGFGAGLPASPGLIDWSGAGTTDDPFRAPISHPLAYAFSGNSEDLHPQTDGWDRVDWDISHLVGQKVRFAFHAWTNPSEEPCRSKGNALGVWIPSTDPCSRLPLDGWTVANVGVVGQQFRGEPIQLRLRVATDGSMLKGDWSIDDILIVGQRYERSIVVRSDHPRVLDVPGTTVVLDGEVRNVGSSPRDRLGLTVEAVDADTGDVVPFDLVEPTGLDSIDPAHLPAGVSSALGPFSIQSGGDGSSLPIRVGLDVPEAEVEIRIRILEDVGACDLSGQCTERYALVRNEEGAGLASATWSAVGETRTDLSLVPPLPDRTALVVADPPVPDQGQPVALQAALLNAGTTAPEVEVAWTMQKVHRKGCVEGSACDDQPHTRESLGEPVTLPTTTLRPTRGEETLLEAGFTPADEGLHRVTLEVREDDITLDRTVFEFVAGTVEPYYAVDFASTPADEAEWASVDPVPSGSPPQVDFRQVGGQFLWGVSPQQFVGGLDYCHTGGCNPAEGQADSRPPPSYGLHGVAEGPLVDLGRVVQGEAVLALRHGHGFTDRDGAAVEALPLRSPVGSTPRAALECIDADGNRHSAWFRLTPTPASDLQGEARQYPGHSAHLTGGQADRGYHFPDRRNPLGDGPVIGGPGVDEQVLRFPLDGDLQPACPPDSTLDGDPPSSLANYTLRLRLRVGTTPGVTDDNCDHPRNPLRCPGSPRSGALGWQVDAISATSVDVFLGPDGRDVPVRDGFPKRFNMLVTNPGPIEETYHFGLGPEDAFRADPDWFAFPEDEVRLAPGETRIVPFEVEVPAEPRVERGRYTATLRATSSLDPSIYGEVLLGLDLAEHHLPDLDIQLEVTGEDADQPPEPGRIAHIVTNVRNMGLATSEPVPVRIESIRLDETGAEVGRSTVGVFDLPPLEPDEGSTHFLEWVPRTPGQYRVEAVADPEGRLIESRLDNSRALALIEVVPLQRPDVRVAELSFEGVGADGYALEGGLVTIVANITNRGTVAATGAQVFILADNAQLVEVVLDSLAPGAHREVTALRVASPGEAMVRALVIPGFGAGNQGDSEHELRRILRVRGIDLSFQAEPEPLALAPGDAGTTRIDVDNTGNAVEKVVFSLDPTHEGWGIAATPNPVTVAPGSSAWSVLTLRAPTDAVAGAYDLTVLAAPQSHPGTHQVVRVPVDVEARVDAPTVTLQNATAVPGPTGLPVLLQSRANVPQDVVLVLAEPGWQAAPHAVTLSPGQATSAQLPVEVPAHAPPGNVSLRVAVQDDAGTVLAEARGTLDVTAMAAGSAQWSGRPVAALSNLTARVFQVTLNVSNDGNVPFEAEAVLSRLSEGVNATAAAPATVPPGGSVDLPVAVRVSPEFTQRVEGRVDVLMRTNHTGDPAVGRIASLDLPGLGSLPDLAITDVSVTPRGTVAANEPVHVAVTVENLGFDRSPATDLYGYVNGEAVGAYAIEPLAEGGRVQVNLTWAFPSSGGYIVHLVADGAGNLTELHDDNNGWTQPLDVEAGDLVQRAREVPAPPALLLVLGLLVALARRRRT